MSYCSRSCRRWFTVLNFKGWAYLVAFTATFSNNCTAHAQKRLFINFRCKLRHRRSIPRQRFPVRSQNFGDLATFSVDFCILCAECPPYFYFRFVWPTTRVDSHVDNSHQVWSWYDHPLPSYSVFVYWYVTWPFDVDLLTLNTCRTWRVTWPTFREGLWNHRRTFVCLFVCYHDN